MNPVSEIIGLSLTNRYYREYLRLLFLYGKTPRYENREIKFLNYNVTVTDCLSFIYQFKEIFVKQYYLFETDSLSPLIYDCGANIGISCLFFKKHFPDARIKAFEADKNITGILKGNLQKNNIKGIEVYSKAIWINNQGLDFYSDSADAGSVYGKGDKVKVDSIRLKEMVEQEQGIIDFLKMDIEGAETEVIIDLGDSISKIKNIFIEYHSFADRGQDLNKILGILSQYGFRYFINSVYEKHIPFKNKINVQNPAMDLQLNIFAYKNIV